MKSIVIVQDKLMHYRSAFLLELSKNYNVYVFHSGEILESKKYAGKVIFVKLEKVNLGPFRYQKELLSNIEKVNPCATILTFDIRWLSSIRLVLNKKVRPNIIWWGLDVGKSLVALKFKLKLAKLGRPIIFYSRDNMRKFINMGLDRNICFTANNTFDIGTPQKSFENINKRGFLFVGSFDRRKGVLKLLDLFTEVKPFLPAGTTLTLVGDGECFDEALNFVNLNIFDSSIKLVGRVEDPDELQKYYEDAYASISYSQAGLSVLQSLGFGVPFMALKNSISGGEIANVLCGFNGYLPTDDNEFKGYLIKLSNLEHAKELGENAYKYYKEACTIEGMVSGFKEAIEFNE